MVMSLLAWGATVAPRTTDISFDVPALTPAEPLAALAPTATTAPPPATTTTTAPLVPLAPLVFDPIAPGRQNRGGDKHDAISPPAIGMMEIPKIGLVHPIFEGLQESVIHWGPGHWPGTAEPGHPGNAVYAGHRVTHTQPFLDIDLLAVGDQIIFRTNDGIATYEMYEHLIVAPDATWIGQPTPDATVTIFACHPKRSAAQRYVVRGRLVGFTPRTA
jgi:sortase A